MHNYQDAHNDNFHQDTTERPRVLSKAILGSHSGFVRSKFEFRETECKKFFNYTDRVVSVVRLDTYETVETRPMKDEEAQMELSDAELTEGFEDAA